VVEKLLNYKKHILIAVGLLLGYLAGFYYLLAIFLGYLIAANALVVNVVQSFMLIVLLFSLHYIFKDIVYRLVRLVSKDEINSMSDSMMLYWLSIVFDIVLVVLAIMALLLIWGVYPPNVIHAFDAVFFVGVKVGKTSFSVWYVLKAVIMFLIVYYIFRFILYLVESRVYPFTHFDEGTQQAVSTVIGYIGLFMAIIMAVYSLGISSTSLAFVVSAFTFGLSFGLKEIFNNFVSGLILLIERPIKAGDWVDVGGESGVVKRVQLRATVVETFDRKTLMIPNSQFVTTVVSNDLFNPISRSTILVECSYDDDLELVQKTLLNIVQTHEDVLQDPPSSVIFNNFGGSGIEFKVWFFCPTRLRAGITSKIRNCIFNEFKRLGIEIPYPKREIYLHKGTEPSPTPEKE